jgi:regulator of sirC expression with transglutaminase-like and TPR domain
MINPAEIGAIFSLLDDPSSQVQDAVRARILGLGEDVVTLLRTMSDDADGAHHDLVEELAGEIRVTQALERMNRFIENPERPAALEEAVHAISRYGYPDADIGACLTILDDMAADVRILAGLRATPVDRFMKLRSHLFSDLGFLGNRQDYYNPDNSYFNRVLELRKGIPISLSVLMMLVGQRLQVPLYGIGMPMHFLLQYDDGTRTFYVDAFNAGMIITQDQCRSMLHSSGVQFAPAMLSPISAREIIERMWRNLYLAYQQAGDEPETARVARVITVLNPEFQVSPSPPDDSEDGDDDDE